MALRVAELETLFTADIRDYEKKTDKVDAASKRIEKSDPTVKIKADEKPALAAMSRVQDDARKIDSTTATAKIGADASKATAGIGSAAAALARIDGDTASVKVTADTAGARSDIKALGNEGSQAGEDAGEGISAGILAAIIALPVAGAIVGAGAAIGKSLTDGLQVEVRSDRLMAQTGLDPASVAVLARASGEAYGNNWGDSLAANMDTARVAIQGGLLDPGETARNSQAVIESLSGVADILGEEIPRVARSTTQLLRTGLATSWSDAFDLIVKGGQAGLNVSEDLLDTIDEYSTQFRKLGLDGPQAFGLLAQAVRGGARDTDTAADAIKEFSIRAIDGSKTSADGYKALGLSAKDMSLQIAKGGEGASKGLDVVLDRLRAMEDPVARDAAAVALFGTKAEDLGSALGVMDLSTAVSELGKVEGAAGEAMSALGDNAAGQIASAQRNIEVAADGIKGALATAFGPQIEGFATFVTENRATVMQFLLDLANGGINAGRALANAAADGIEGFGSFVGVAGPAMMGFLDSVVTGFATIANIMDPTGILGFKDAANDGVEAYNRMTAGALDSFKATESGSKTAADAIRTQLIANGLDPAQERLNAVGIPLVAQAALHDASVRAAQSIDQIGYAADGSGKKLDINSRSTAVSAAANKTLSTQIRAAVTALDKEAVAGAKAGDSQASLTTRYEAGRQQLIKQLVAMGFTAKQAQALTDKYNAIPGKKVTNAILNKDVAAARATALQKQIDSIRQNKVPGLNANSKAARDKIAALQAQINALKGKNIVVTTTLFGQRVAQGPGGSGGIVRKDGGAVFGPGTTTSDSINARLSNDEHVLTADDVKAAGGHKAVYAWRKSLHGFAGGGAINVSLPDARAVQKALNAAPPMFSGDGVSSGASGSGGTGTGLVAFGHLLQRMGFQVGEHPLFGGVAYGAHVKNSRHYAGRAIDVNHDQGSEMAAIDSIIPISRAYGLRHIWRAPNHWDHAHFDYDKGGMMAPGGMGMNHSAEPERVLTGGQTKTYDKLLAVLESGVGLGGGDMSGVRADLATVAAEVRTLGQVFGDQLQQHAQTIQRMQRQMAGAR